MANNGGQINIGVGFNVDTSALGQIRKELMSIQNLDAIDIVNNKSLKETEQDLKEAKKAAMDISNALENAFNKDLGTLNISKFSNSLNQISNHDLNNLYKKLQGAGDVGVAAFNQMARQVLLTNSYVKQTDKIISKIGETLGNTIKWNISSSIMNKFTGSIQEAWGFTKALDGSLNDIRIVTNKSAEDMDKFAAKANKAAQALGKTTVDYTKASLTFYQQGLSDKDVQARTDTTLKVSNVTGLESKEAAEYVTAVANGYKVAADSVEESMDKLAAVGAATASSLSELAEGMAKVASTANAMGVSEDQLAATLSTVIAVTRQDASSVGTAFKTIYARISDIEAGVEGAETSLGNYTKTMADMGFNVLDSTGHLRDLGQVMEEIGGSWANMNREQQISLAQTMAGTRQYNNLIALFDNWDEYQRALNVSMEANGTLQKQQETYAESLTAKLNKLTSAKENLFSSLVDTDGVKDVLDGLTTIINKIASFSENMGGLTTLFTNLGAIALRVFNKQISESLSKVWMNLKGFKQDLQNMQARQAFAVQLGQIQDNGAIQHLRDSYNAIEKYLPSLTAKQQEQVFAIIEANNKLVEQASNFEKADKEAKKLLQTTTQITAQEKQDGSYIYKKNGKEITSKQAQVDIRKRIINNQDNLSQLEALKDAGHIKDDEAQRHTAIVLSKHLYTDYPELNSALKNFWKNWGENNTIEAQMAYEEIETFITQQNENLEGVLPQLDNQGGRVNNRKNKKDAEDSQVDLEKQLKTQQTISAATNVAGAIMGVTNAIQTLKGLGNIWNDEDLSTGDKLVQIFMALGSAAMAVIPSISALGVSLKLAFWEVTLIVGAVAGLVALFSYISKEQSNKSGEGKLKKLQAASDSLKNSLDEAKQAAEDLQNSFDNYNNAVTKLKECTKGTQEWKDALQEVNNQALELLDTVPELAESITRDENGMLVISGSAQDEAIQKAKDRVNSTQLAYQTTNIQAKKQANENEKEKFLHNSDNFDQSMLFQNRAGIEYVMENIDELSKLTKKEREQKLLGLTLEKDKIEFTKEQIQEIEANYSELQRLSKEAANLDLEEQFANQSVITSQIGDTYGKDTSAVVSLVSSDYQKTLEDTQKKWLNKATGSGISAASGKDNATVKEIWDAYSKATNTNFSLASNAVRGTDTNRSFAYIENGETKTISAEEVASRIAAAEALDSITDSAEKASSALSDIDKNLEDDVAQSFTDFIATGDLGSLTKEEYDKLNTEVGDGTTDEFIRKAFGVESNTDLEEKLGLQKATEIRENFVQAMADYETALNSVSDTMHTSTKSLYEDLDNLEKVSLHNREIIADILDKAFEQGGAEGAQAFQDIFKSLSSEELDKFAGVIGNIDWNYTDAFSLQEALQEAGITTQFTTEQLKGLIKTMKTDGLQSIDGLRKKYEEINSIISGLKQGDTISAEDYNKLSAEAKGYFTQMIDGTFKLTSDAEQFYNLVHGETLQGFADNIAFLKDQNAMYEGIKNNGSIEGSELEGVANWNNKDLALKQLDFLKTTDFNKKELADLEDKLLVDRNMTPDDWKTLSDGVMQYKDSLDGLDDKIKENNELILAQEIEMASTAKDLEELNQLTEKYGLSSEAYNSAALQLDYQENYGDLDAQELKDYSDYVQHASQYSDELSDSLKDNDEAAKIVAKSIMRMNKGVETLSSNFEEWSSVLKKSSKSSEEYYEAMSGTRKALSDLLDISEDYVSDDYVSKHLDDIAKAAKGDAEAIDKLKSELSESIVAKIAIDNDLSTTQIAELNSALDELQNRGDIVAGTVLLDNDPFVQSLQEMANDMGLTVDQINAMADSLGYDVQYETQSVTTHQMVPEYDMTYKYDDEGKPTGMTVTPTGLKDIPGETEMTGVDIASEGNTHAPKIKGVTKKAGGAMNNASSSNKGGKGSGGGGGGKKAQEPVHNEQDRYHDVNQQLKELSNTLDVLQEQEDELLGQDLVDNLNEQLSIINATNKALEEKIRLKKEEAAELRGSLGNQGVTFDDKGRVTNYNEAIVASENRANAVILDPNSTEEQVEAAKKANEEFLKDLEKYETIMWTDLADLEKERQANIDKMIELNIKKFDKSVQLRLDLKNAKKDWNTFKKKVLEGQDIELPIAQAQLSGQDIRDTFAEVNGKNLLQDQTDHLNKAMQAFETIKNGGIDDVYGNDAAKALEGVKKYQQQVMETMTGIKDAQDQIQKSWIDQMKRVQDAIQEVYEGYNFVNEEIEHNITVMEKLYSGTKLYDALDNWYSQKTENDLQHVAYARQQVDALRDWLDNYQGDKNSEEYKTKFEQWKTNVQELNQMVEQSIDDIQNKYSNSIENALTKKENEMTGGFGMEATSEEWELMQKQADMYLDTINATFGVQQLQSKYMKAMNDTSSLTTQKKLNDIMSEELKKLETKDKLSQYDLDRANAKYELTLKQIALEEAQQNKSQMRLRRDSQGNYSYQYVADQDAVDKAKDEVNIAQNNLYNMDKDAYNENLSTMYDLEQQWREKIKEIRIKYANDDTERLKQEELANKYYGEMINSIVKDNTYIQANLKESMYDSFQLMRENDNASFKAMTGEELKTWDGSIDTMLGAVGDKMVPGLKSRVQTMIDYFKGNDGFTKATQTAFDDMGKASETFKTDLKNLQDSAGINFEEIRKGEDSVVRAMKNQIEVDKKIVDDEKKKEDAIKKEKDAIDALVESYKKLTEESGNAAEAAQKLIEKNAESEIKAFDLAKAFNDLATAINSALAAQNSYNSSSGSSSGGSTNGGYSGGNVPSTTDTPPATTTKKMKWTKSNWNNTNQTFDWKLTSGDGTSSATLTAKSNNGNMSGTEPVNSISKTQLINYMTAKGYSFKTGGYTGSWPDGGREDNGRLAFLHQKELVLNEQDTENLLKAIMMLRDVITYTRDFSGLISESLEQTNRMTQLQYQYELDKYSMMKDQMVDHLASYDNSSTTQNIEIHADFSNITSDIDSIKSAFDQMLGMASQKVNSKRR